MNDYNTSRADFQSPPEDNLPEILPDREIDTPYFGGLEHGEFISQAEVMAAVSARIWQGDIPMPSGAELLRNHKATAKLASRVVSELNKARAEAIAQATDPKEAAKICPIFKDIPATLITDIIAKADIVKVSAPDGNPAGENTYLIRREYDEAGNPRIWQRISPKADEIIDLIMWLSGGDTKPSTVKNIMAALKARAGAVVKRVEYHPDLIFFPNCVVDRRAVKWNAEAGRYDGLKVYEWGTPEADELARSCYPIRFNSVRAYEDYSGRFDELFPLVNSFDETWDPISGIKILSDDPNVQKLLFQILLNAVRGTNGGTVWILLNAKKAAGGANGKSTFIKLIEGLIGESLCLNADLVELGNDFKAAMMADKQAIIAHELPSDEKIRAALIKKIGRQEVLMINGKYKDVLNMTFHGMHIQAVNGVTVNLDDRTASTLRRLNVIRFEKDLNAVYGHERREIKEVYAVMDVVIDYLLWYVLNCVKVPATATADYYDMDAWNAVHDGTAIIQDETSPISRFLADIFPDLLGDTEADDGTAIRYGYGLDELAPPLPFTVIPVKMLYDMYSKYAKADGNPRTASQARFSAELMNWCERHKELNCYMTEKPKAIPKSDVLAAFYAPCCLREEYESPVNPYGGLDGFKLIRAHYQSAGNPAELAPNGKQIYKPKQTARALVVKPHEHFRADFEAMAEKAKREKYIPGEEPQPVGNGNPYIKKPA